jgi:energy-converting hydrogenase B subunit D
MVPLQVVTMLFVAVGALAVVLARDIVRQAIVLSIYGLGVVVLFVVFQAPDVALSALVVSGIAYPLVLVAAIAKVRSRAKHEEANDT